MSKIPCAQCGVLILTATCEKTGGLCMPCANGTRESMEESQRWNEERRNQLANAARKRAPLNDLRMTGYRMQFRNYLGLEDPAHEIFLVALDIVYDKNNGRAENIERLSNECRLVYLVECFEGEIHNGGFDQLFTNSLGNHCLEILEGLNTIGADISCGLLRQALSWFPNHMPSNNRQERWTQHEKFSEKQTYETDIDLLDKKFYKDDDKLLDLLKCYVMRNELAFICV